MSRIILISNHTASHVILSWLCDRVSRATLTHALCAHGPGWRMHYVGVHMMGQGSVIPRKYKIIFDDHVDTDLITQFALTFG